MILDVLVGPNALPYLRTYRSPPLRRENPGMGGTEWVSLEVARICREAGIEVRVIVEGDGTPPPCEDFEIVVRGSFDAHPTPPRAVTIAPEQIARRLGAGWRERRLIIWFHHPHVQNTIGFSRLLELRPAAFVSVGQYAHASNVAFGVPHVWIPNPFPRWAIREPGRADIERSDEPIFGFVGALLPPKGFHLVAEAWGGVRAAIPGARLQVIGSASLYGYEDGHRELPTVSWYGEEILDALGPARDSVEFLGRVTNGKAEVYAGWDAALLNPTGTSEADPSSLKEVVAAGVPPVASADLGMWDIMRFLPDLVVRRPTPEEIVGRAVTATRDHDARARFARARSRLLSESLDRDARLADAWSHLIDAVAHDRRPPRVIPGFAPARPSGVTRARLLRRNAIGPLLVGRATVAAARARRSAERNGAAPPAP